MKKEKQIIKDFYDTYGWHKNGQGVYKDVVAFVDTRPVLDEYRHNTHMRVKRFMKPEGKYYLDAGSGAVAHSEHIAYSSGYHRRVCVDLSAQALREARTQIGKKGFYVQADVTRLPFKDDVFDTIMSAHVLYHIPEDEQEKAVLEMRRTLSREGSCVVIYAWNMGFNRKAAMFVKAMKRIKGRLHGVVSTHNEGSKKDDASGGADRPPIYSHHHGFRWFRRTFSEDGRLNVYCWRSVDRIFTKVFIPNNGFGKWLMRCILRFEETFPYLSARIGRYPIIVFCKNIGIKTEKN
jgi:ubiquinone/menaquinone biosynthesis C-methylase UbiE